MNTLTKVIICMFLLQGMAACSFFSGSSKGDVDKEAEISEADAGAFEDEEDLDYDPIADEDPTLAKIEKQDLNEDFDKDFALDDGEDSDGDFADTDADIPDMLEDDGEGPDLDADVAESAIASSDDFSDSPNNSDTSDEFADDFEDSVASSESDSQEMSDFNNEEDATSDVAMNDGSDVAETSSSAMAGKFSVKKIKTAPYQVAGNWVNGVYIARDGENMAAVSKKIYGTEVRAEDLLVINPHFRTRDLKVGSKIYYNSPLRPNDSGALQAYYEERNIRAQIFVFDGSQGLRVVAENLLGHKNSWMEIWATNPELTQDDKWGSVASGVSVQFWPEDAGAALASVQMANNNSAISQPKSVAESEIVAANQESDRFPGAPEPEEGVEMMAEDDIPPPPPEPNFEESRAKVAGSVQNNNNLPLPPTPALQANNGRPSGPMMYPRKAPQDRFKKKLASAKQKNQMMLIVVGGVIFLVGLFLWMMIRKKKSGKEIDFNHTITTTNID